jgi:hypothetical protein
MIKSAIITTIKKLLAHILKSIIVIKTRLKKAYYIIKLIPHLGLANMMYVFYYKLSLKYGFRKKIFPLEEKIEGPFFLQTVFKSCPIKTWDDQTIKKANQLSEGIITYFSYHKKKMRSSDDLIGIPDWFYNPFDNTTYTQSYKHWTEIDDFGEGDIKIIWELSRFDWLTDLARAYKVSGNTLYLERINLWLADWCKHNPTNLGPNWKCGQETSFRIMKLLTTARILDQLDHPSESLKTIIYQHVVRVEGNIHYGIAQENNHSTSEAIGLYVGSLWLLKNGHVDLKLNQYKNRGQVLLERMIDKLVLDQGTFSQLSTNYHRVFLDTMSFCLDMMEYYAEAPFDSQIQNKLQKSGEWLYKMIFGKDGDVPNFGSNDGAMIENLHSCSFRDFRPSVQLFFALLKKVRIYNNLDVSESMFWRCGKKSLQYPIFKIRKPSFEVLDKQAFISNVNDTNVFIKIPDKKFRQGNDALHVDLWYMGNPILIDTGTYSYNAGEKTHFYKSVKAHNTSALNDGEQLVKLSRFLNGGWFKPRYIDIEQNGDAVVFSCEIKDYKGCNHKRAVSIYSTKMTIRDTFSNFNSAISTFHFAKNAFSTMKGVIDKGIMDSQVTTSDHFESKYYLQEEECDVLRVLPERNELIVSFYYEKSV